MKPEEEPSPSRQGYIPVETTNVDSTSNKSTNKFPTTGSATTITIKPPHREPRTIFQTQPPFPPRPPPEPKQEKDIFLRVIWLLVLLEVPVLIYLSMVWASGFDTNAPEIHVHAVSFSLQNLSSAHVTTKGEITFNVTNPLDCAAPMYGDIVVSIFYDEEPLSMTIMEPFTQTETNHTMVKALFPSKVSQIETWVSKGIAWDFISNSSFEFSFDVEANGRLWPNNWTGPEDMKTERFINIWCPSVKVEIVTKTGVGKMIGEPLKCQVMAKDPLRTKRELCNIWNGD